MARTAPHSLALEQLYLQPINTKASHLSETKSRWNTKLYQIQNKGWQVSLAKGNCYRRQLRSMSSDYCSVKIKINHPHPTLKTQLTPKSLLFASRKHVKISLALPTNLFLKHYSQPTIQIKKTYTSRHHIQHPPYHKQFPINWRNTSMEIQTGASTS